MIRCACSSLSRGGGAEATGEGGGGGRKGNSNLWNLGGPRGRLLPFETVNGARDRASSDSWGRVWGLQGEGGGECQSVSWVREFQT